MKKLLSHIYHNYYKKVFPDYPMELNNVVGDIDTLLDIGCGDNSPVQFLSSDIHKVGVDIFQPSIDVSKKKNIHSEYVKLNVLEVADYFDESSFDCAVASDLIEHLEKKDGYELIRQMERVAKKRIIIFTPNGFLKQGEYNQNPWQVHHSGWTPEEMEEMGFRVYGINGLKSLRGEFSRIRYRPYLFWRVISDFTQLFLKNKPKYSFQMLCVKEIESTT